jgi:hypothetical protein
MICIHREKVALSQVERPGINPSLRTLRRHQPYPYLDLEL